MSTYTIKVEESRPSVGEKPSAGPVYRCIYAKDGLLELPTGLELPWEFFRDRNFTYFQKIYGLVQCTEDISSDCIKCLRGAIANLPFCCDGKQGGRVLRPSCNLRYEIYPFFQSSAPSPSLPGLPPLSPNITTTNSKGKSSSKLVVIIVVPLVIAVLSTIAIWWFCFRRKKTSKKKFDDVDEIQGAATDNFSGANMLGEGGFGSVYKGKLSDGQEIAVKRLSENSGQGQQEFKNEVLLLAKLQHKNLVRLLGFSLDGEEKLLIYEYMPNASLDHWIG